MTYVITARCIDVKDLSCLASCPVDCIYQGGRTVYIHPDECINCGLCETVCPVDAIYSDDRLPSDMDEFIAINAEFFGPNVTGWNSPRGADDNYKTNLDHPRVTTWPRKDD